MNEEVSRDVTGEADGMDQRVDSRDGVTHSLCSLHDVCFVTMATLRENSYNAIIIKLPG